MNTIEPEKNVGQQQEDKNITVIACPCCDTLSDGQVCKHCGENLRPKRITFYNIIRDIPDVFFDVDNGLFYTMRTFLLRPGKEIRKYFAGDRKRHYKPLKFVLFIGDCNFPFRKISI